MIEGTTNVSLTDPHQIVLNKTDSNDNIEFYTITYRRVKNSAEWNFLNTPDILLYILVTKIFSLNVNLINIYKILIHFISTKWKEIIFLR